MTLTAPRAAKALAPLTIALLLAACGPAADDATPAPAAAPAPAAGAAAPEVPAADATTTDATTTEAIYGDEAPVAVEAVEPAEDHGHAHNADGSHAEPAATADDAHDHGPDADHEH